MSSEENRGTMNLGAFSLSLAVKDIARSRGFYESLGFAVCDGKQDENWLIMRNGDCVIGLFQDMLDKNTVTFNPGWDTNAKPLDEFTDVRELQRDLKAKDVKIVKAIDAGKTGPAHFVVADPDGNPILFDQHR